MFTPNQEGILVMPKRRPDLVSTSHTTAATKSVSSSKKAESRRRSQRRRGFFGGGLVPSVMQMTVCAY